MPSNRAAVARTERFGSPRADVYPKARVRGWVFSPCRRQSGRYRNTTDNFFQNSLRGLLASCARPCQDNSVLENIWNQGFHVIGQNVVTTIYQGEGLRRAEKSCRTPGADAQFNFRIVTGSG